METYVYPVLLELDENGTVLAGFPDFGEGATFGEDEADALTGTTHAWTTSSARSRY